MSFYGQERVAAFVILVYTENGRPEGIEGKSEILL